MKPQDAARDQRWSYEKDGGIWTQLKGLWWGKQGWSHGTKDGQGKQAQPDHEDFLQPVSDPAGSQGTVGFAGMGLCLVGRRVPSAASPPGGGEGHPCCCGCCCQGGGTGRALGTGVCGAPVLSVSGHPAAPGRVCHSWKRVRVWDKQLGVSLHPAMEMGCCGGLESPPGSSERSCSPCPVLPAGGSSVPCSDTGVEAMEWDLA